jgi:hypothetical protein
MPPPPGPLVDTNSFQGGGLEHRSCPHQPQERGGTDGQPQAGGEPGTSLPTQGHADRPQDRDQPMGLAGGWRDQVWEALGEDATRAGRVPAEELPDRELEMYGARPPREVRQVALIAAMDGR